MILTLLFLLKILPCLLLLFNIEVSSADKPYRHVVENNDKIGFKYQDNAYRFNAIVYFLY